MIQSACRKAVKLSNMQMNAVKNYVKNYEQWADKLLAAFAYPAGCGSYNVAPKCQIKGKILESGIFYQYYIRSEKKD